MWLQNAFHYSILIENYDKNCRVKYGEFRYFMHIDGMGWNYHKEWQLFNFPFSSSKSKIVIFSFHKYFPAKKLGAKVFIKSVSTRKIYLDFINFYHKLTLTLICPNRLRVTHLEEIEQN
jgi:hypothetical protein